MLHISVVLSSEMLQLKNRTRLMLQMNWEENTRGIKTTPKKKEIWNIQQSTFIDFFLVRWVIWTDYCSLGFLLYRKSSSVYFLELYNTHWQVIYYYNGDKLPVFLWKKNHLLVQNNTFFYKNYHFDSIWWYSLSYAWKLNTQTF